MRRPRLSSLLPYSTLFRSRNPADPRLAAQHAEALGLSGRFQESAAEYARAIQLEPEVPLCWYRSAPRVRVESRVRIDRKSTRLKSSHANISYAVFSYKKKK